ncbi:YopX family protein [Bacillus cereus]|uniref:YopX family protein n=1 Tax=Bacillus cereus TaxID=1396 RepID=UPI000BFCEB65|nr:YopX family protein [Bacillus cereus]PGU60311.1 hypothetical protein COD72_00030 [Bacillus cereus]
MREIKFRVWSKHTKKMLDDGFYISQNSDLFQNDSLDYKSRDLYEVMQYTGLKDKNGTEIYEGDIVDTVYDGKLFTGVVVYDESELDFKATNGKENYGSNFQYLMCCEEVEVIGNIYENPELLEESK